MLETAVRDLAQERGRRSAQQASLAGPSANVPSNLPVHTSLARTVAAACKTLSNLFTLRTFLERLEPEPEALSSYRKRSDSNLCPLPASVGVITEIESFTKFLSFGSAGQ